MATLVLGAVGAAVGGSFGGSVLGLSGAVIGRAVGATVGRAVDQAILGTGAEAVEVGRMDRLRLTSASEGAPVARAMGRVRLSGQVIWASRFKEHRERSGGGGGKGGPKAPEQTTFSYSVSLAIALCEGEIRRIGRVWADGAEIAKSSVQMRIYSGTGDQMPDALIEAIEGVEAAPAYRGLAYVVFEDLDLTPFGNRVPQLSFEVVRVVDAVGEVPAPADLIEGVAIVPGTGEYALATTSVHYDHGGEKQSANVNSAQGKSDFLVATDDLLEELPNLKSASLVVSWFGDDLRCGHCSVRPRVEQTGTEGKGQRWNVSGATRSTAGTVPMREGRPLYGGTPSDASVIEAIRDLNRRRVAVTFYPFILMDQVAGNGLPDPYGSAEQPALPWRGRITTSQAPGRPGTTDRTSAADGEVARFFGTTRVSDFSTSETVSGPAGDWSYRRFILHYATLCAKAGGVEAFCVGSEMRGLTQIRGAGDAFPSVAALVRLASDVRTILPNAKISYAADWSEYFGYHPEGSTDVRFHLDPFWASPDVDFIGIDNYMPLSDWRDGDDHVDAGAGSILDIDYLRSNIEGGEGYDWYYGDAVARTEQRAAADRGRHVRGAMGLSIQGHRQLVGKGAPRPHRWLPQCPTERMGAEVQTDPLHRVRLRGDRQRGEPAQQVPRPEIVRVELAVLFERSPGRCDADAVSPGVAFALERSCAEPRLSGLRRPNARSPWQSGVGMGRASVALFSGVVGFLDGCGELWSRSLALRPDR